MQKFKLPHILSYFLTRIQKVKHNNYISNLRLDGGKYLLPMLSEIHHCDYSNCVIEFNLKDVQKSDVGYYSPVDVEIHNKTRFNVDDDTDMDDWFYDLDNMSMIESLTYETMPDGCDADFDDVGADIFVD